MRGLRIARPTRADLTVYPPASTSPDVLERIDVAFVLTKSIDTDRDLENVSVTAEYRC